MDQGNLDTSDVLLNRGLNGYYGGGMGRGGGYGNGFGNFPGDGSAVKEAVRGNRDIQLLDSVNHNQTTGFLANQIDRGHQSISDNVNQGNQFITDRIFAQSIDAKFANITQEHASLERTINVNNLANLNTINSNDKALLAIITANDKSSTDRDFTMSKQLADCCCELQKGISAVLANQSCDGRVEAAVANASQNAKLDAILNDNGHRRGN